jgi:xylulokinase
VSLLSIDVGSSSCKAVAFSEMGEVLTHTACPYSPRFPQPAWVEMDAEVFWQALCTVTRDTAPVVVHDPVTALSICSHGESFLAVDSHNQPLAPAILNVDNRAVAEAEWLSQSIGRQRAFNITGLVVHPMYPLAKILWLKQNRQEIFSSSAKFLSPAEYLLEKLGLPALIDYSLASRFLAFDIRQRCWSNEILNHCGLDPSQFSAPVAAGTVAGKLSGPAAHDLGLPVGALVVVGGHDQPCAALGMGVITPGRVSGSLGTYECILSVTDSPSLNDAALAANLNSYCHVVPNRFVTLAYFPAGLMLDWFLRLFSGGQAQATSADETFATLEAAAPVCPTGLLITPHLIGTCNPDFNPYATGTIVGLRSATNRSDIYKGILEGLACELRNMTEILHSACGTFRDIYVTGGGCHSRLGLRLRAAFTDCRLHLMRSPDSVCLGGAILAGVAAGIYESFREAVDQLVHVAETVDPDPALLRDYSDQLARYRQLYPSLAFARNEKAA